MLHQDLVEEAHWNVAEQGHDAAIAGEKAAGGEGYRCRQVLDPVLVLQPDKLGSIHGATLAPSRAANTSS